MLSPEALEDARRQLSTRATRGDWKEVLRIFKMDRRIHSFRITISGDTALHLAIADGRDGIAEELVTIITEPSPGEAANAGALRAENERGNTPLHLSAALGSIRMCRCIALRDPILICSRNFDTPLFLAALHGRKDAFLLLHDIYGQMNTQDGYFVCRRIDGDNILHCAIAGEHFDLAYQIIARYWILIHYRNERGFTPLHVLAGKPAAFKSGSHLGRFSKMIYHCISVDKLVLQRRPIYRELGYRHEARYPENYKTCMEFAQLLKKLFGSIIGECR